MPRAESDHSPLVGFTGRRIRRRAPVRRDRLPGLDALAAMRLERRAYAFTLLAEISDYASVRRSVGVPRAAAIIAEIATRVAEALPDIRLTLVGRTTLELSFDRPSVADGHVVLTRIHAAMTPSFDLDGEPHRLALRIGGAAALASEVDDVRLIEAAEEALVDARQGDVDVLRDLSDPTARNDPGLLMRELPDAIESGQIFLQYQPKVRVRQQRVASAEALVRWRHPTRGLILPGDFIEAAERANIIGDLTLWTIRRVIVDQRAIAAAGYDIPIFINISGMLLSDPGFVRDACALVREGGAKVGFEITETAVIRDPESAIANLKTFAEIGVPLAIDDYGAGLSSLAYLKRLPASELKIDKLFVTQLTSSNRDPLIVRSTIDLAHALDMEVTAEGVETPAALALLGVMGCDMVQGYLISRPVEFAAFRAFLEEERHMAAMVRPNLSFQRNHGQWKTG